MGFRSLFARTGLTIAFAILVFMLFSSVVVYYYLMVPIARQASNDLAALISLSAQTWVELPPKTRPDFEYALKIQHDLSISQDINVLDEIHLKPPFLSLLEQALVKRHGKHIKLHGSKQKNIWLWTEIPIASRVLYLGFSKDRINPSPPTALFIILSLGSLITVISSLLLVRYLNLPLLKLSKATTEIGQGKLLTPLQETGPSELALLAKSFNQMAKHIQILLTNRTTLLAGISHDLRTPISRMQLALEMIKTDDKDLIVQLQNDLIEMNQLITRTLELSKSFEVSKQQNSQQQKSQFDLNDELKSLVAKYTSNCPIELITTGECTIKAEKIILQRIITNLLENAIRYGNNKPVTVRSECTPEQVNISILDRGNGIPEDEYEHVFQPFYRLESSRSQVTGGSGLGLAIVQQLCHSNGWSVELLARDGGGTEAILRLKI